jgi:hypothetical protein
VPCERQQYCEQAKTDSQINIRTGLDSKRQNVSGDCIVNSTIRDSPRQLGNPSH